MTSHLTDGRAGHTLIELTVTVALIGIIGSVAALAVRRFTKPDPRDPMTIIGDTIEAVLKNGTAVTLQFTVGGRPALATVNPDGSVLADSVLHIERLTGAAANAR